MIEFLVHIPNDSFLVLGKPHLANRTRVQSLLDAGKIAQILARNEPKLQLRISPSSTACATSAAAW